MLHIDRLSLRLPAGYEQRHDEILELLAAALARLPLNYRGRLDTLKLPPIEVDAHWSNHQVAERISQAIAHQIQAALPQTHSPTGREQA